MHHTSVFAAATLALTTAVFAQQSPAPIQRSYIRTPQSGVRNTEVIPGVLLRTAPNAAVETLSANSDRVELRITHGVANVSVHQPAGHTEILVDLPGGQTALVEDGLYTFNAASNTVRVYTGQAQAFAAGSDRSVRLDEGYFTTFAAGDLRAIAGNNTTARADVLPGVYNNEGNRGEPARRGYGNGPYGDGYYAAPYAPYPYYGFGYGYPYGYYGYPYGYGFGLGFGYYGGFGRGYYGGGYRFRR